MQKFCLLQGEIKIVFFAYTFNVSFSSKNCSHEFMEFYRIIHTLPFACMLGGKIFYKSEFYHFIDLPGWQGGS